MTDETRAPLPEIRRSEGYDQDALDAASREVHMMLLREGSSWGTKACEEMGRVFMTAYRKALPAAPVSTTGRIEAALHACEGLATVDLARNEKGWLAAVVHAAARVESSLERSLRARCPGNGDGPGPVECQSYEASEQGAPCPPGCCVMAEAKDMRSVLAAIEADEGDEPNEARSATGERQS